MEEIWKTIEEFPKYMVSNTGKVKNSTNNKLKSLRENKYGYLITNLYNGKTRKTIPIHKLVIETFLEKRPLNKVINHIDGIKKNNNLENLEYLTSKENTQHAFETGLVKIDNAWIEKSKKGNRIVRSLHNNFLGEDNPMYGKKHSEESKNKISQSLLNKNQGEDNNKSKLTSEEVIQIRELYSTGEYKQKELAKKFNVDQTQISNIIRRKSWKNI